MVHVMLLATYDRITEGPSHQSFTSQSLFFHATPSSKLINEKENALQSTLNKPV
jgi:hypothetical protein